MTGVGWQMLGEPWGPARARVMHAMLVCTCLVAGVWAAPASAQSASDEALRTRVQAALNEASDVPTDSITVEVSDGVVTLSGSVVCDDCAGTRTPPGAGTVQQSLGAVVRAVPGVERVEFRLRYRQS